MIKKILLTLSIFIIGFTSFSYGADSYTCSYKGIVNEVARSGISTTYYLTNCNNLGPYYDCNIYADVSISNGNCYQIGGFDLSYYDDINLNVEIGGSYISFSKNYNNLDQLNGYTVCSPSRLMIQGRANAYVSDLPFTITTFPETALTNYSYTYTCSSCDCPTCPSCSQCEADLLTCQSDLSSCQNDLANCGGSMTGDCQENTGDVQWSSLYINDIQHLGSENINITIPEEISWNYTGDDQNFDLDIEGYNVDSDYIAGIITTQNSKPSKSDLNYIISSLLPLFVPGLVIILFIYFVFKFIKKAF